MFFRKEREFYAKYSPYEREIENLLKWFDLKTKADLPSDIECCDRNIRKSITRLQQMYTTHVALVKWKEMVRW